MNTVTPDPSCRDQDLQECDSRLTNLKTKNSCCLHDEQFLSKIKFLCRGDSKNKFIPYTGMFTTLIRTFSMIS
jgi:hypothetical protein